MIMGKSTAPNFKPPPVEYTKSMRTKISRNFWKNYYTISLENYWNVNVDRMGHSLSPYFLNSFSTWKG